MEKKVNILGTEYTIFLQSEDKRLANCDAFCDKTTKELHICRLDDDCDLGNPKAYEDKLVRHEIVHAFLYESGLTECWEHKETGHEETVVDWIATMAPKLLKAFQDAECI